MSDNSNLYLSVPSYMLMEDDTCLSVVANSGPGLYEHELVVLVIDLINDREAMKPSWEKCRTMTTVGKVRYGEASLSSSIRVCLVTRM